MNIYPAVLTESLTEAQAQLNLVADVPVIKTVQLDIIDGQFANNLTITPADLPELVFGELSCDLHLMTEEPLDYVFEAETDKSAIPIRAMIGQLERMSNQVDFIHEVKKHNWLAGLSLDLFTPLESIDERSWFELDIVQLMSIEAGFQGQPFHPAVLDKIEQLRQLSQRFDRQIEIVIDGGIKPEHVSLLAKRGADSVAVGSGLWQSGDIKMAIADYLDFK